MSKNENTKNSSTKNVQEVAIAALQTTLAKSLVCGAIAVSLGMLLPEIALAGFDIDKGVKAAADPLVKGLTDHWGKGVLLSGGAAALIGEGDPRQRAIRAGVGCGASGGVMLLLLAMLS